MSCMPPDFDPIPDAQLRNLAGPKVYARGKAYHAEGRVTLVSVEAARVVGRVLGREAYRGELRHCDAEVEASCECRAFEDWGFCKHLVAIAFAAAEAGAGDRAAALRTHLVGLGAEALADLVIEAISRDPALRRKLEDELADAMDDDDAFAARIRRDIAAATDVDDFVDYAGAGAVADDIDAVRERLERLADGPRAPLALDLASALVDGLARAVEASDDSEGEIHAAGGRVIALHARLCAATRADPLALAEDLFERALGGSTDLFTDALDDYAEALGEAGRSAFRGLAEAAWGRLPAAQRDVIDGRRSTLRGMLDQLALADGDVEARITLRKAELTRPSAYIEIADICLDAGREAEALRWLEEGLWCFEGLAGEEQLADKAADLMTRAGRTAEALALRWRSFERTRGYHAYLRLRDLPDSAAMTARALALLRARAQHAHGAGQWNTDAGVLFDVLLLEGRLGDAWDCAHAFGITGARLEGLANASADSHQGEAVAAYEQLAEDCIRMGGAPSYDAAVRHVMRRGEIVRDAANQAAYVAALSARHKAKRTLVPKLAALSAIAPRA